MERLSLTALLDEDREKVQAGLSADRELSHARQTLEKAIDRVMYRYVEACDAEPLRRAAQCILQAMKDTLPLTEVVGEVRMWKKEKAAASGWKARVKPRAVVLLAVGAVLVLAPMIGLMIAGRVNGSLSFVRGIVLMVLGCAGVFLAGLDIARPPKGSKGPGDGEAERAEYLADPQKAWHLLRGAMLQADGQMERLREEVAFESAEAESKAQAGKVSGELLELFAQLLETARASADEGAREAAASIRFYLHSAGVETVDYEKGRESWFEFLPADRPGTLRPALVQDKRLLKKGLASA